MRSDKLGMIPLRSRKARDLVFYVLRVFGSVLWLPGYELMCAESAMLLVEDVLKAARNVSRLAANVLSVIHRYETHRSWNSVDRTWRMGCSGKAKRSAII